MSRLSRLHGEIANDAGQVINLAAGTTTLDPALHSGRLLIASNAAAAMIVILPQAVGSGDVYEVLNVVARTSGALTFKVNDKTPAAGTNLMNVMVRSMDSSAVATDTTGWFMTNATQISLNNTTTGGLGGDSFRFVDGANKQWFVQGITLCSGDKATPLTAAS